MKKSISKAKRKVKKVKKLKNNARLKKPTYRSYRFAGDDDDKNGDEKENPQEISMNKPRGYNKGESFYGCNDIRHFPFKFYLCMCDNFQQYCITFSSGRSRLFTLIGETHYPIENDQNMYLSTCRSAYPSDFIDTYLRLIYEESKKVYNNENDQKIIRLFTELTPTELSPIYNSNNLFRLEQSNKYYSEKIIYEKVDIRDMFPYEFFEYIYNYLTFPIPDEYTLLSLIKEQSENSHWRKNILPFLETLITKDSRYKLENMYEPEHLVLLKKFYQNLVKKFNSIRSDLQILRTKYDNMSSISIAKALEGKNRHLVKTILDKYIDVFVISTDLYTLIQVFRKDYAADHILYLVGSYHVISLNNLLSSFKIYEGKPLAIPQHSIYVVDITNSFY